MKIKLLILTQYFPTELGVKVEEKKLFIDKGNCGLYFEPENKTQLINCINQLIFDIELRTILGNNGRKIAANYLDRDKLADNFYENLLSIDE